MKTPANLVAILVYALIVCGCGGGGGGSPAPAAVPPEPPDPPAPTPPPPTGIQVALNRSQGSSAQLFSAVVQVGTESDRATDRAPAVLDALAPGDYVVELGDPTAGCQAEGDTQQDAVVSDGSLTTVTFDVSCTFTPESRIVFMSWEMATDNFTVWTIRPDGTELQQVAEDPALNPAWSKDGTRIAYWSGPNISIMNWDGSEKTPLSPYVAAFARWSPDGSQIVFTTCCMGSHGGQLKTDIWKINIDGTGLTQLTTDGFDGVREYRNLDWSPDGSMIVFDKSGEIGIIDTNGSPIASLGPGFQPSWSPDGSKIVFTSVGLEEGQIWVMNIDGSDRTQLTDIAPNCGGPSYRSDGAEIIFHCPRDFVESVWRMDADGSSARRFVEIPGPAPQTADWFML